MRLAAQSDDPANSPLWLLYAGIAQAMSGAFGIGLEAAAIARDGNNPAVMVHHELLAAEFGALAIIGIAFTLRSAFLLRARAAAAAAAPAA